MSLCRFGSNKFFFWITADYRKINKRKQSRCSMLKQSEFAKTFYPFNINSHGDEPANHRNELPEEPMLWTFRSFQDDPRIVKRYPGFVRRDACFFEHSCQSERGKKDQ